MGLGGAHNLLDELANLDIAQVHRQVFVANRANIGLEFAQIHPPHRLSHRQKGARNPVDIAGENREHQVDDAVLLALTEPADQAKVDKNDGIIRAHQNISRVRIAVEKPVVEHHLDQGTQQSIEHRDRPLGAALQVGELLGVDKLHGQNFGAGEVVKDLGNLDFVDLGEVAPELLDILRFLQKIELIENGALKLAHDGRRGIELDLLNGRLEQARQIIEQVEVAADLLANAGALHFDNDRLPVAQRRQVGLADGGCSQRFFAEFAEELLELAAQSRLNLRPNLLKAQRRHAVLQVLKLGNKLGRQNIRARREHLTKLDEGRPQVLQDLSKTLGGKAPVFAENIFARQLLPARPLGVSLELVGRLGLTQKAPQPDAPRDRREPVARQNTADLAQTPDILNRRFYRRNHNSNRLQENTMRPKIRANELPCTVTRPLVRARDLPPIDSARARHYERTGSPPTLATCKSALFMSSTTPNIAPAREITLDLSGLKIRAKVWGPDDARPVLSAHGWLDNAGTFDTLAPMLPVDGLGPTSAPPEEAPQNLAKGLDEQKILASTSSRQFAAPADATATIARVHGISQASAAILMQRGLEKVEGGADEAPFWRFTYDLRLRGATQLYLSEAQVIAFFAAITCPTLLIRPDQGWPIELAKIQPRLDAIKDLEVLKVEGNHHVHLDHPERISQAIQDFLSAPD